MCLLDQAATRSHALLPEVMPFCLGDAMWVGAEEGHRWVGMEGLVTGPCRVVGAAPLGFR